MSTYANVHTLATNNVGDLASTPIRYLDFPVCEEYDVTQWSGAERAGTIIIGGGGMCLHHYDKSLTKLVSQNKPTIVWGIGLNNHTLMPDKYPEWLKHASLVGVRDWQATEDSQWRWVPCPSCMHPAFDKVRTPRHRYVIYSHVQQRVPCPDRLGGTPEITNVTYQEIEPVLDFLGSGEIILTNSYHGAYWGTLLGRRVIAWPWSSKFMYLKHKPLLVGGPELMRYVPRTTMYPEALQECRDANRKYYNTVLSFLMDRKW